MENSEPPIFVDFTRDLFTVCMIQIALNAVR